MEVCAGCSYPPSLPLSLLSRQQSRRPAPNPSLSRDFRAGYEEKGENYNCLWARRDNRPLCRTTAFSCPQRLFAQSKIPRVTEIFSLIRYVYLLFFFSSFVLRQPGELLDGKQPGCQDKVFCRIRDLFVGVFFPRRNQFLELPVRRQWVNSPLDFTAWERCDPGLKSSWVQAGVLRGVFKNNN